MLYDICLISLLHRRLALAARAGRQVGDIVLCPGKWANQDMVGLVTATQVHPPSCIVEATWQQQQRRAATGDRRAS
jgi:hypothetical protein